MANRIDKTARADQVIDAALKLFLERPRDEVTFELVAERSGLKFWQVYHFHGKAKTLFRAAVSRVARRVRNELSAMPTEAQTVRDAAWRYTEFAAGVMRDEAYAQFVYLLIRDRCVEPMLEELYERRIARVLRDGLEAIVGNAGQRYDLIILLSPAATREFVKSLEVEFVLPKLLPGFAEPSPEAVAATIRRIADRVISAAYAIGSEAA